MDLDKFLSFPVCELLKISHLVLSQVHLSSLIPCILYCLLEMEEMGLSPCRTMVHLMFFSAPNPLANKN